MFNNLKWVPFVICFLGFGTPMGIVPGEEDPLLMRMAPQNAILYASWAGTQEADPKGNSTEQWIAQKDMQRFWKDMDTGLSEMALQVVEQADNPVSANLNALSVKLPKLLCRQPCGIYLDRLEANEKSPQDSGYGGVLAINLGDRKNEIGEHLALARGSIKENESVEVSTEYEIDWLVSSDKWLKTKIGIYEQYLVIGFSSADLEPEVSSFFENKDTPEPSWLTAIKKRLPVPRRASVGFIDVKKLHAAARGVFAPLENEDGFAEKVTTIGFVNGLDDEGYLGRIWLPEANEAEFAKVFNGAIDKDFLSKMPAGELFTVSARVSEQELYNSLKSATGNAKAFEESIAGFEGFSGLTLKQDLLNNLSGNFFAIGSFSIFGSKPGCLCFQVKDEMAFLDTMEGFARRLKEVSDEGGAFDFETIMIDDIKIHHVTFHQKKNSVKQIYFAQRGFQLVVGNEFRMFKEVLFADKTEKGKSWIESERVRQLYGFAKDHDLGEPQLLFEIDPKPLFSLMPLGTSIYRGAGFAKPPEPPRLPDEATMANGVEPNLNALFKCEDGIEIVQKHVMPVGNPVSFLGFAGVTARMLDVTGKISKD